MSGSLGRDGAFGQGQFRYPFGQLGCRDGAAETAARDPGGGRRQTVEIGRAGTDAVAAGGAEGDDGLTFKIIVVQESADDPGSLPPPDGISQKDYVVSLHAGYLVGDGGTGGGVILLLRGAAGGIAVIEVGGGVGVLRHDLIEIRCQYVGQPPGYGLGVAGAGKIGDQDAGRCLQRCGEGTVHLCDQVHSRLDPSQGEQSVGISGILVEDAEEGVGAAVAKCGVARDQLFLTTKVWISNGGYEKAKASIEESLRKLKSDYIDLMLIHQPFNDYYGTYRAMEEAYREGKLRAIGVSNFYPDRLVDLCQFVEITPAVNQVGTHPFLQQGAAHEIMKKYGVQHESWGPFAEGKKGMFSNPVIQEIGGKYGKSAAQTILRFLIQSDVVVIPKSTHQARMAENFDVFDFSLSEADMEAIRGLDEGTSAFLSHQDPATVEFLTSLH